MNPVVVITVPPGEGEVTSPFTSDHNPCEECNGTGQLLVRHACHLSGAPVYQTCHKCKGTGLAPEAPPEFNEYDEPGDFK